MSTSLVLFLFIFSLSTLVGSINGQTRCGKPSTYDEELHQKQMEMSQRQMEHADESMDRMGRIGLECETQGYGGGSGSSSNSLGSIILGFIVLFFIVGTPIVICIACARRQKAINAAATEMAQGTDLKSYPETKTAQKGDLDYKV